MASVVDMRGILFANINSPYFASNYPNGDRGLASWQLAAGHFESYLSPIIVHPRPNSETGTNARHRNGYTGQAYRVPVVQQGGAWPFYYEIISAPAGVTIGSELAISGDKLVAGADYGIVNWPSPTAGTHTINIRVTDQNLTVNTISWTVVVGTSNWVVLDKSAGTNGSGTLASPYNTESSLSGQSSKCVLVRAGTIDSNALSSLNGFPRTWVPYNGETVNWKVSGVYGNSVNDFWLSGINIILDSSGSATQKWFWFEQSSRTTFFENLFNGANLDNTNSVPDNSSVLFWQYQSAGLNGVENSLYNVTHSNEFKDIRDRDLILSYSQRYTVNENNKLNNYQTGVNGLAHGFYSKIDAANLTLRRNYSSGTTNTAKLFRWDSYTGTYPVNNNEASHNSYRYYGTQDYAFTLGYEDSDFGTNRFIYRNNVYSNTAAWIGLMNTINNSNSTTVKNNIAMSPVTANNGIYLDSYNGQLVNSGNINGNLASGILDASNNLVSRATPNLGTAGAEIK